MREMRQSFTIQQIQAMIDRIRMTVTNDRYEETPELRDLSQEFAQLARSLNQRLQLCGELLRQGLRGEAIEEAEAEPNLLDAVGLVTSFSDEEQQAWQDLIEFLELTPVEPILNDAALMLDAAYEEYQPLERLLRSHRRLALQRAPLAQRMVVLRKLFREDQGTEFWESDLRNYENVRINEISEELRKLSKRPVTEQIVPLREELESQDWLIPIPARMLSTLKTLQKRSAIEDARQALHEAEEGLRTAFSEMNFSQARHYYDIWQANWPLAGLSETDPLAIAALPPLSWCEQEIRRESAEQDWNKMVGQVEQALAKDSTPLADLQKLSYEVDRFERPLPTPLANRLKTKISSLTSRANRQRMLIIAGSTVATILIAGLVTTVVLQANEARYRSDVMTRIAGFVEQGNVPKGEELIEQFDERWREHPDWIDAKASVDDLRGRIEDRTLRLDTAIQEAQAVPDANEAKFQQAIQSITAVANEEPVLDSLVSRADRETRNLTSARTLRLQEKETGLFNRLKLQGDKVESLKENLTMLDLDEFNTQVSRTRDALSVINNEAEGMNPQVRDQARLLQTNIDDLIEQMSRHQKQMTLQADLAKYAKENLQAKERNLERYITTLTELEKLHLGQPEANVIQATLKEADSWKSLKALCQTLPGSPSILFPKSIQHISQRQAILSKLIAEHGDHLDRSLNSILADYKEVLDVLGKRYTGSSSILDAARSKLVEDAQMKNLYAIRDKNNQWPFYVESPARLAAKNPVVISAYRIGRAPLEVKLDMNNIVNLTPQQAPQRELAKSFQAQLKSIEYHNWESTFAAMAHAVADESQVDPILRLLLLSELSTSAKAGSRVLDKHQPFQEFVDKMNETIRQVNPRAQWPDPVDPDVQNRRDTALLYLKGLGQNEISTAWGIKDEAFEKIDAAINMKFATVGLMVLDDQAQPACELDVPAQGRWKLIVLQPEKAESAKSLFEEVGQVADGKATLSQTSFEAAFQPYRIVFAHPD